MEIKDISEGRKDMFLVDAKLIHIEPGFNLRIDLGDIAALAASIKANGFMSDKPLRVTVEQDVVTVRDGHRRLMAMQTLIADKTDISPLVPCVVEPKGLTDSDRIVNQIISNDGLPLTPLEEGAGFKKLIDAGMKPSEIAEKIGKSHVHVRNRLSLVTAPEAVQEAVKSGEINVTTGIALTKASKRGATAPEITDALKTAKAVSKSTPGAAPRAKKGSTKPAAIAKDKAAATPRVRPLSIAEITNQIDEAETKEGEAKKGSKEAAFWRGVAEGLRVAAKCAELDELEELVKTL
jgi:ParB/RepB/Spo0J family partition protein